jgi:prevent-host-death family protein
MTTIPVRELRNDVSTVLRRVEAGETLTVTVQGRPVAQLTPLNLRPRAMPWAIFRATMERAGADAALADELADALPATTDDV